MAELGSESVKRTRNWTVLLAFGLLALGLGLCLFWYWQRFVLPAQLTHLHSQEFLGVIAQFETTQGSLETQLHPEKILSVATDEYLRIFQDTSTPLNCQRCDQFLVITSAEASGICVIEYSPFRSVVRATVIRHGNKVDATTYELIVTGQQRTDRSTYHLVKENDVWKVTRITDYAVPEKGSADPLRLEEFFQEMGCR